MALIKCPDCGEKVSDKASACIHCGCPIHKEIRISCLGNKTIDEIADEVLEECDRKRRARELRSPFPLVWNF